MKKLMVSAIAVALLFACTKSQLLKVIDFQDHAGNAPPIFSDVVTIEDTIALVYEDVAVATVAFDVHFYDVPFGSSQPSGYGAHLTRYTVTFESVEDPDDVVPSTHEGALNVIIPPGEEQSVSFVLVTAESKGAAPLVDLALGGELRTKAIVEFFGTEDKTGQELQATGELQVNFANWADD